MSTLDFYQLLQTHLGKTVLNFGLIVIDMQNGFLTKGGSYDKLGMDIKNYRRVVPTIRKLISFCRKKGIPIFYTKAVRERSGIDLLMNVHNILPRTREERLERVPICVRGTWDAAIIDEIKPTIKDYVVIKRRDSAFMDTELRVWLQSAGINTLIFCGVDTSICVETSLRDGFNMGYDVILISDASASAIKRHHDTTLERVKSYYGIVTKLREFEEIIKILEQFNSGKLEYKESLRISEFLEKHKLVDLSEISKI